MFPVLLPSALSASATIEPREVLGRVPQVVEANLGDCQFRRRRMRINKLIAGTYVALFLTLGLSLHFRTPVISPRLADSRNRKRSCGAAYDTTHVYVAPEDFNRFVASLLATFGGKTSKQGVFTVTPTPSSTMSQLVLTPAGRCPCLASRRPSRIHSAWSVQAIW